MKFTNLLAIRVKYVHLADQSGAAEKPRIIELGINVPQCG